MDKGNLGQVGGLVMLAIALIVGAILLQGSAQNVSSVVNTNTIANQSLGVASNSTTVYLTNMKAISGVTVTNGTTGVTIGSGNYTITNNVVYNGALAVSVLPKSPADGGLTGYTWYINGVAEPTAYADSAGRSLTNLIIILMALAMVAIAVGYAVKNYGDM
jgi:hypothetical protein